MSSQKTRRRSSLAPGKIKLQPTPAAGGEFYKKINDDLSPEDRLEELCKQVLQFAVEKIGEEFTKSPDIDFSSTEVKESYLVSLEECKKNGHLYRACHKECNIPNPANEEMEEVTYNIKQQIQRLTQESEQWEKLVTDFETRSTEAEKQETTDLDESQLSEEIRLAATCYLCESVNLTDLRGQLIRCTRMVPLLVEEYTKTVNLMSRVRDKAEEILNKQVSKLKDVPMESVESPRTNIQKILDFSPQP